MDGLRGRFLDVVKAHVMGVEDEQYRAYLHQGAVGVSLYPSSDAFRGFGEGVTRPELVDKAIAESSMSPREYFGQMLTRPHDVVAYIDEDREVRMVSQPVYFFPEMGVYATRNGDEEVLEVWLSWPAYPKGW